MKELAIFWIEQETLFALRFNENGDWRVCKCICHVFGTLLRSFPGPKAISQTYVCSICALFVKKLLHSNAGFYLLSRIEALADMKVYGVNRYFISGHSLEHLCLALVPLVTSIMLWLRSIRIARYSVFLMPRIVLESFITKLLLAYSDAWWYELFFDYRDFSVNAIDKVNHSECFREY